MPADAAALPLLAVGDLVAGDVSGLAGIVGNLEDLPEPLTRLSTTGLLREELPRNVERWIDAACAAGFVRASADQYRTLSLTPEGRAVMAGRVEDVVMVAPTARRAAAAGRTRKRLSSRVRRTR